MNINGTMACALFCKSFPTAHSLLGLKANQLAARDICTCQPQIFSVQAGNPRLWVTCSSVGCPQALCYVSRMPYTFQTLILSSFPQFILSGRMGDKTGPYLGEESRETNSADGTLKRSQSHSPHTKNLGLDAEHCPPRRHSLNQPLAARGVCDWALCDSWDIPSFWWTHRPQKHLIPPWDMPPNGRGP